MMNWPAFIGIVLFSCLVTGLACTTVYRRGIRALWKQMEEFKAREATQSRKQTKLLQGIAECVAGKASGRPICFTAQNGEDVFVYNYFSGKKQGFYLELGAFDGVTLSNTFFLEQLGWRGILIEALPDKYEQCRKNRPNSLVFHAAVGEPGSPPTAEFTVAQGSEMLSALVVNESRQARYDREMCTLKTITVPCHTLREIIIKHKIEGIDFVSLDVEGQELPALKGFPFENLRPQLFIIEDGSPTSAVGTLMKQHGYKPVFELESNWFWETSARIV